MDKISVCILFLLVVTGLTNSVVTLAMSIFTNVSPTNFNDGIIMLGIAVIIINQLGEKK